MGKRDSRLKLIADRVNGSGAVSVRELAEWLNVTGVTVRRDLAQLEQENRLRLMHGVAVSINQNHVENNEEYQVTAAETQRAEEKRAVGAAGADLIDREDIVILDAGTTTEWIARALPSDTPFTVICNSLNIVNLLISNDAVTLIVPGGVFRKSTMMFESESGLQFLQEIRAQKAFISASGVDARLGVTCSNMYEIGPKQAAIASSGKRILVVDSSKFGSVRVAYFAAISDFDIIVTDEGISEEYKKMIEEAGVALVIADKRRLL